MKGFMRQIGSMALVWGFLLGVKGDHLALWIEDDPEPVQIFSCRVSTLPPADQLLLRRGISIQDNLELAHLLEDYS